MTGHNIPSLKFTVRKLAWAIASLGLLAGALLACKPAPGPTARPDLAGTAAVQATAILQQAQATALILKAQAQATALVKSADLPIPSPTGGTSRDREPSPTPSQESPAATGSAPTGLPDENKIEITRVTFAAEGVYIYVEFKAPPKITHTWMQGNVSVMEEATGAVYNEIPVAPVIGPLIARPIQLGQLGYAMLVNAPNPLSPGAMVTVVLGKYQQEHIKVQ